MDPVALFALGLLLLAVGAPLLVYGAARLDRATGRSAFAVGAIAAAFGPAVAVLAFDLAAVLRPAPLAMPRLALGALVGGNVASVGLVLGLAALARPLAGTAKLFSTTIPLLIAATALFWFLASDKQLDRTDGGILLGAFAVALVVLVRAARRETDEGKAALGGWAPDRPSPPLAGLLAVAGLTALVGGAVLAAEHAIPTAQRLKFRAPVLGEAVAAVALALPAAVGAVVAARRGRGDVALALAIGPALANVTLVCGVVSLVRPLIVEERVILNEVPAMGVVALLLLPALFNGLKVSRWEGAVLLAAHISFVVWVVGLK